MAIRKQYSKEFKLDAVSLTPQLRTTLRRSQLSFGKLNQWAFFLLCSFVLLLFANQQTFAHAGPHAAKDCFIQIDATQLRFNGHQFQGKHPGKFYCRFFPLLGNVIISVDSPQDVINNEVSLQWLELLPLNQLITFPAKAFKVTQETAWKPFNKGVNSIKQTVDKRGIYGLNILLKDNQGQIQQQSFYFLAGIPVTLIVVIILVVIACLLLLFIAVIFIKQRKS